MKKYNYLPIGKADGGALFVVTTCMSIICMALAFVGGDIPNKFPKSNPHGAEAGQIVSTPREQNTLQLLTFKAIRPKLIPTIDPNAPPLSTNRQPGSTSGGSTTPAAPPTGFFLGAAIEPNQLDNPAFTNALRQYRFNSLTPENAMKFGAIEPNRNQFSWAGPDKIVNYAQANNMRVRGHTLVWHIANPGWINGLSNADARTALQNHITMVVGRYRGRIAQWDVVNEAFDDTGALRNTPWRQKIGPDYIALAFQWAREADPNVQLCYNDFGTEGIADRGGNKKVKSDAVYNMVRDFKARGIPIDCVGLQTHSAGDYPGTGAEIGQNIQRLRALGVQVEITELDVINIADQAGRYAELGRACKENGCSGITTWGLYDGHSFQAAKLPLLLDTNFRPKPAYNAFIQAIGL